MDFVKRHRQGLVDLYIFLNIAAWTGWSVYGTWRRGELGFVEITFTIQTLVFLALILVRRRHRGLDANPFHQAVAAIAFFSGLAFMGQPATGGAAARLAANAVTLAANILGILALVSLGRSFGVLIALRGVRTGGVYALVRHPMYLSDILFRAGFLIAHFNGLTSALLVASSACYVYRALLEERFLRREQEYRDYMNRVRYRFVPYVF
jgi:protein-S-isoprenylcysteine O-methyltransferase Ste14